MRERERKKEGDRMRFEEALKAMREGKRVKRLIFGSAYLYMKDGNIYFGDRAIFVDEILAVHILAEDWEIMD